jgi:hypothetical protein
MPVTIIHQDLVTVSTTTAGQSIVQQEDLWADVGAFQDLGIAIFVAQAPSSFTSGVALYIENAPLREEALFTTASPLVNINGTPSGPAIGWNFYGPWHLSNGSAIFMRYLRWRAYNGTGSATNTWQFRILLTANPAPR